MQSPNKKLSQRESILGFVTLAVLLFGYFNYWYIPHQRSVQDDKQKLVTVESQLQQRSTLVGDIQRRLAASIQENNLGNDSKEYLPASRHLGLVLRQIVGEDPSLTTNSIKLIKTDKQKEFKEVQMTLEIEGTFKSIGSFVERLENTRIMSEVLKIDVLRIPTDLERCIAKLNLKVRLFGDEDAE